MQGRKHPAPLSSFSAAWVGHTDPAQARCSGGYRVTGSTGDFSFPVSEPTSSGTTNPSLGKSKPLHHPSLRLGAKAPLGEGLRSAVASGGGSALCRRLYVGRDGAFVSRSLRKGRGLWGGGRGAQELARFPLIHNPVSTALNTQSQRNNHNGTGRNWGPC